MLHVHCNSGYANALALSAYKHTKLLKYQVRHLQPRLGVDIFRIIQTYYRNFFYGSTALVGLGLHIVEASRSHSDTPRSVGSEPSIPESERLQTHAFHRAVTGIGTLPLIHVRNFGLPRFVGCKTVLVAVNCAKQCCVLCWGDATGRELGQGCESVGALTCKGDWWSPSACGRGGKEDS